MTAKALRNGWLHTGDGGNMDAEGFLYIVDRVKDMIVSGGENVYSAETEEALYPHPAVAECAVIGVPDETWGERASDRSLETRRRSDARGADHALPHTDRGYKCPRTLELREEPLPLSGAGKILKAELRRPFWEGKEKRVN